MLEKYKEIIRHVLGLKPKFKYRKIKVIWEPKIEQDLITYMNIEISKAIDEAIIKELKNK